jgi:hypothetical protein
MMLSKAKAEVKKINRQIGQLNRRFVWNYERIEELKAKKRNLEKFIAERQAANEKAAWIWE